MAVAAAMAAALTVGMAGSANAGAIAYADLQISNFFITANPTGTLNIVGGGNTGSANASLNGTAVTSGDLTSPISDNVNPPLQCVGNCAGIGENNYNQTASPGTANHFSRGDSQLVLGAPSGTQVVNVQNADVGAETSVQQAGSSFGGGQGSVGNNAEFTIDVGGDTTFDFSFDASRRLFAQIDGPPDTLFGNATATTSYSITVADESGVVFNWEPGSEAGDPFNLNQQASRVSPGTSEFDDTGSFSNSVDLGEGRYFFTIGHQARTTAATEVPEPSTLALLGFGLIGGGLLLYGGRRRQVGHAA